MSDVPPPPGAPISWGQAPSEPNAGPGADDGEWVLGFRAAQIGTAAWLPDDPMTIGEAIADDGRPFRGAFVPLVIHDPTMAERSFDAAEFAADLIRSETGKLLCVTPFAEREWVIGTPLSRRQWNHAAAMLERLEDLCVRFGLQPMVGEMVDDRPARADEAVPDDLGVHHVLDTGSFVSDGYVPTMLISPERLVLDGGPLTDRLRGYLRGRTLGR